MTNIRISAELSQVPYDIVHIPDTSQTRTISAAAMKSFILVLKKQCFEHCMERPFMRVLLRGRRESFYNDSRISHYGNTRGSIAAGFTNKTRVIMGQLWTIIKIMNSGDSSSSSAIQQREATDSRISDVDV